MIAVAVFHVCCVCSSDSSPQSHSPEDLKQQYAIQAAEALFSNQLERARELYQKLLTLEPQHHGYHAGLGETYFRLGNYEQAIEHYEKSLLLPNIPRSAVPQNLAVAYLAIGRQDKVVEIIRQFMTTDQKRISEALNRLRQELNRLTAHQPR